MRVLPSTLVKRLYKPEYFYRPSQFFRRFKVACFSGDREWVSLPLSWGSEIEINASQTIGRSIRSFGLYDLALSEFIYRVLRKGDSAIDVGANVGYTTKLMGDCLMGTGRIISFEPLPNLFKTLQKNVGQDYLNVELKELALSDHTGRATITIPDDFTKNDGIATLESRSDGTKLIINTSRLDDLALTHKIRLMKIDVEGHEMAVLMGALQTLKTCDVDFILYEDLGLKTNEVNFLLIDAGYKIFKLIKSFTGLKLVAPDYPFAYSYDPDNYVALKDISLVHEINSRPAWKILAWEKKDIH